MSLAQYASPYNNESETDNNKNQINKNNGQKDTGTNLNNANSNANGKKSLRKTIRRPPQEQSQPSQSRVSDFMNKLNSSSATTTTSYIDNDGGYDGGDGGEDGSGLADYNNSAIVNSESQQSPPQKQHLSNNDDENVTKETFMSLPSSYAKQYYQQYIPYHQNETASMALNAPKDEFLQKMNHIIQMLEDQQDEKTGNVTEELILYCFLGVFVIFVVDSFARAGKYVR